MTEYVSQLETLLPCKELLFSSTPGFGDYKPFLSQATAHPAKINTTLAKYLIETLTKEGDVVLDPMSGSGSIGVISALLGRDAVCVELEEKFHGWQLQAKEKVRDAPMLTRKGSLTCIKGDARNLSELLKTADVIVTSPPYVQSASGEDRKEFWEKLAKDPTSCRYGRELHPHTAEAYGLTKDNIGNLPMGEIGVIITSPPYVDTQHFQDMKFMEKIAKEQGEKSRNGVNKGHFKSEEAGLRSWGKMSEGKLENSDNIGNLSQLGEINVIITSPPYEESLGSKHHSPRADKISEEKSLCTTYTEAKKVDVVITSPPYSEGIGHGHAGENASHEHEARLKMQERYASAFESEGNIASLKHGEVTAVITSPPFGEDVSPHTSFHPGHNQNSRGYTDSKSEKANMGNLKKETYLHAMLKCYSEMFKVLKPNGSAAIVVKPFIRDRAVVDLPYQTWLLMQTCGFQLTKLFKLRLEQQSFWRILYMRKNPLVPQIWHEYILVCEKPLFLLSEKNTEENP